jgi:hypothetical protein
MASEVWLLPFSHKRKKTASKGKFFPSVFVLRGLIADVNCHPRARRLYIDHSRMDDDLRLRLARAPAGKTRRFREIGEGEMK